MYNFKSQNNKQNAQIGTLFVILGSILAIIVGSFFVYIGFFLDASLTNSFGSVLNEQTATGYVAFQGNVAQNSSVNISYNGVTYPFAFDIGAGVPAGYIQVPIATSNGSLAAQGLATAINTNIPSIVIASV